MLKKLMNFFRRLKITDFFCCYFFSNVLNFRGNEQGNY